MLAKNLSFSHGLSPVEDGGVFFFRFPGDPEIHWFSSHHFLHVIISLVRCKDWQTSIIHDMIHRSSSPLARLVVTAVMAVNLLGNTSVSGIRGIRLIYDLATSQPISLFHLRRCFIFLLTRP